VLGAVAFRDRSPRQNDPRIVRVGLKPLIGADIIEIWHASGPVNIGFDGIVRYAADADHMLGAIELDERDYGGIAAAAEAAYTALSRFVANSRHPNLLRIWNYIDGINQGEGDNERYKLFCNGRAAGLRALEPTRDERRFPAATCIGRREGDSMVQVYWLAGRAPGLPLENPRQVSAYRYPREYGVTPPSFSRAMLASDRLVMISGTASIVGHASRHRGNVRAQLDETFTNLANVLQRAAGAAPGITTKLGPESLLKIYLRDEALLPDVQAFLDERVPSQTPYIVLHAEVCRTELLVEIDCLHGEAP
jgi:chorismate lyase/3-hydroxybenzoate synthase